MKKLNTTYRTQTSLIIFLCCVYCPLCFASSFFDPVHRSQSSVPPPPMLDLRHSGRVFSPIDQGDCNQCFLTAPLVSFEYWSGTPLSLSCIGDVNGYCGTGGYVERTFNWALRNTIPLSKDCTDTPVSFRVDAFEHVESPSVDAIKSLIWKYGPIVTNLRIDVDAAKHLNGDIDASYCADSRTLKHSVAVVGYTSTHFIIKNSWGTNWNDGGFGKIAKHTCGFGKNVWYVTLASLVTE